jgi:D-threo-aldose 1-dehydrogenase
VIDIGIKCSGRPQNPSTSGSDLRRLGLSGLSVSALGVGGGTLATGGGEAHTLEMLEACWEAGLRYYDTAPLYVESERRLGRFMARHDRSEIVISTKVGRMPAPPGERRFSFSQDDVTQSLEASLDRLGVDYIDVVALHDLTPTMLGDAYLQARRDIFDGTLDYLAGLKKQGVVRALGVAVYDPDIALEWLETAAFDSVMIVGAYTLLNQRAEDALIPYCEAHGVGVLAASPFHTGLLVTGAVEGARFNFSKADAEVLARVERIERVCRRHGVRLPTAALQFPLRHGAVSSVVVGQRTPVEVFTNMKWLQAPIPGAFWEDLVSDGLLERQRTVSAGSL